MPPGLDHSDSVRGTLRPSPLAALVEALGVTAAVGTHQIERLGLWLRAAERMLPAIYAAAALPLIVFFAFAIPAFRVPDEVRHFARAELISTGTILTRRQGTPGAGGVVDTGIDELDEIIS